MENSTPNTDFNAEQEPPPPYVAPASAPTEAPATPPPPQETVSSMASENARLRAELELAEARLELATLRQQLSSSSSFNQPSQVLQGMPSSTTPGGSSGGHSSNHFQYRRAVSDPMVERNARCAVSILAVGAAINIAFSIFIFSELNFNELGATVFWAANVSCLAAALCGCGGLDSRDPTQLRATGGLILLAAILSTVLSFSIGSISVVSFTMLGFAAYWCSLGGAVEESSLGLQVVSRPWEVEYATSTSSSPSQPFVPADTSRDDTQHLEGLGSNSIRDTQGQNYAPTAPPLPQSSSGDLNSSEEEEESLENVLLLASCGALVWGAFIMFRTYKIALDGYLDYVDGGLGVMLPVFGSAGFWLAACGLGLAALWFGEPRMFKATGVLILGTVVLQSIAGALFSVFGTEILQGILLAFFWLAAGFYMGHRLDQQDARINKSAAVKNTTNDETLAAVDL